MLGLKTTVKVWGGGGGECGVKVIVTMQLSSLLPHQLGLNLIPLTLLTKLHFLTQRNAQNSG